MPEPIEIPARHSLKEKIASRLFGQDEFINTVTPYIDIYNAGLNYANKPIASLILLGPTGTGKTHAVETVAWAIHNSDRNNLLRIDCAEFQLEHEIAKLVGAPPGYLGHKETSPRFTQAKLAAVTSKMSAISVVLFDEIEKASPAMARLLLGVLDKGTLSLGDGNCVNFENTMVFFTSNVGASEMRSAVSTGMGFQGSTKQRPKASALEAIGLRKLMKAFPPEFLNRIDSNIVFQSLSKDTYLNILKNEIEDLNMRLRLKKISSPEVVLEPSAAKFLLAEGVSDEYGARELRRVVKQRVVHPVAQFIIAGAAPNGSKIFVSKSPRARNLTFKSGFVRKVTKELIAA